MWLIGLITAGCTSLNSHSSIDNQKNAVTGFLGSDLNTQRWTEIIQLWDWLNLGWEEDHRHEPQLFYRPLDASEHITTSRKQGSGDRCGVPLPRLVCLLGNWQRRFSDWDYLSETVWSANGARRRCVVTPTAILSWPDTLLLGLPLVAWSHSVAKTVAREHSVGGLSIWRHNAERADVLGERGIANKSLIANKCWPVLTRDLNRIWVIGRVERTVTHLSKTGDANGPMPTWPAFSCHQRISGYSFVELFVHPRLMSCC